MEDLGTIRTDLQDLRKKTDKEFQRGGLPTEELKLTKVGDQLHDAMVAESPFSNDDIQSFVRELTQLKQWNFRTWQVDLEFFSPKQVEGLFQSYNMRAGLAYSIDSLIQEHFQARGIPFHDDDYYRHEDDGSFIGTFHPIRTVDLLRNYHELIEQLTNE